MDKITIQIESSADEQNEFLLEFDKESLNYGLINIYTAFIQFFSKFLFNGEIKLLILMI